MGIIPKIEDKRVQYVPVGCGNCIECRKKWSREWQIRLTEEAKHDKTGQFVTLTFSNEELKKLMERTGLKESNALAKQAVRWFLERWRKEFKKSVKHWFITELGHENTERIHIHGIIYTTQNKEKIQNIWQYGKVDVGYSMNGKVISYITKYMTKIDQDHKTNRKWNH